MSEIQIRVVNVEFLRSGPAHNQLLSPLTQYLAVCNDSSAGVVRVPYEQARFELKQNDLRYGGATGENLRTVIDELGEDMGKLLGGVPGLPGALSVDQARVGPGGLVHLRITLSASELAMLPFELAKVPVSATQSSEAWLGLQTRPPVAITRSARTVSPEAVNWSRTPRVLFISSHERDVPFDQHRRAIGAAVEPFLHATWDSYDPDTFMIRPEKTPAREQVGRLLTILHDPTLEEIRSECRADPAALYTHVHILAHGLLGGREYGLALRGEQPDDPDDVDVVGGERLANALTVVDEKGVHVPTVVTLAGCDSGGVGSLVMPGAHVAHALHVRGVPLVVASQFPLSKPGSEPLAKTYAGLLGGEHPLLVLHQLRSELHARYTKTFHDWASVVVYEALPPPADERMSRFRYEQRRRALEAALEGVDQAVDRALQQARERAAQPPMERPDPAAEEAAAALSKDRVEAAIDKAEKARDRLPREGPYAIDCIGLTASAGKRIAQAVHTYSHGADSLRRNPYEILEKALVDYEDAVQRVLVSRSSAMTRGVASLHWVLVQAISLRLVLGKKANERSQGAWEAAKFAADLYLCHPEPEQRAWAHASLAELWLLKLADPGFSAEDRGGFKEQAVSHTRELVKLYPAREDFPIRSTLRQVERYIEWWGQPPFEKGLKDRHVERPAWNDVPGLLESAGEMQKMLGGPLRPLRRAPAPGAPKPDGPSDPSKGGGSGGRADTRAPGAPAPPGGPAAQPAGEQTLARRRRASAADAFLRVEMLPADHGDCLWIEYGASGKTNRVLVDCGTQATAERLLEHAARAGEKAFLELFVMTHVDADHIGGALPFFKAVKRGLTFGDVWFNGWEQISGMLGPKQGEMFTTALKDFRLPHNVWQGGRAIATGQDRLPTHQLPGGLSLTLLSPSPLQFQKMASVWVRELDRNGLQPGQRVDYANLLGRRQRTTSTDVDKLADSAFTSDTAAANGMSIALLAEYEGAAVLLGADAYAPVLVAAIHRLLAERGGTKLKLDAFKLPHHGSRNNLSRPLLDLLDCPRYLVSSDGGYFEHPDREAIARVVKYGGKNPTLYFNYTSDFNQLWARPQMREKYPFTAHFPREGQSGQVVPLLGPGA